MAVRLTFEATDNNGRPATTSLWLPGRPLLSDADAYVAAAGPLLQSIMTARLTGARLSYPLPLAGAAGPLAGAASSRVAVLFYSDGLNVGRIIVPSMPLAAAETAGEYSGRRITRESLTAAGLLDEVEALVVGLVTPQGVQFPPLFDVGAFDTLGDV